MQEDFHYYATYCAAYLAGCSHEESLAVAYSAQFVDCCTDAVLVKIGAPVQAETTQLQPEMIDGGAGVFALQEMTRVWASFHFLPQDLTMELPKKPKVYQNKRRLVCGPNGALVSETVELAKGKGPVAAGVAMHVLADTWAHRYFAGTPSLVINNTNREFYDVTFENGEKKLRMMKFNHNPASPDVIEKCIYTNTVFSDDENSVMNLGHGRAGHLPDISCVRYQYLPAWGDYEIIYKDNPADYWNAFCQMVYAMKYLRGCGGETFETEKYDTESTAAYEDEIMAILTKQQLIASEDWKKFGESLSGQSIPDFDIELYQQEYMDAEEKKVTFLGQFADAAVRQKNMVTARIFESGSLLAGFSAEYTKQVPTGMQKLFRKLKYSLENQKNDKEPKD